MSEQPWYANGLKFSCTQCGNCCTGAPGYVWVNKMEIAQLAELIGENDIEAFEAKHVRKIGVRKSLQEFSNGDCVFFDGQSRRCTVYSARPRQCRSWPFWGSNVRSQKDWERTCDECPGSGKGKLYSITEIEASKSEIRI